MPESLKTKAFNRGKKDYLKGIKKNPYIRDSNDIRYNYWWSGWYHKKIEVRLSPIFEKYNIDWDNG